MMIIVSIVIQVLLALSFLKTFMRVILLILVFLVAITSCFAAVLMLYSPSVELPGIENSGDFLFPNMIFSALVAGCNLIAVFMIMSNSSKSFRYSLAGGITLVAWVIIQMMFLQFYHWLQPFYLVVGILIGLLSYHLMGKAAF